MTRWHVEARMFSRKGATRFHLRCLLLMQFSPKMHHRYEMYDHNSYLNNNMHQSQIWFSYNSSAFMELDQG